MRRQIVFWLPQGRLGNLIFQYQAAISLFPQNSMIISPESEFLEVFEHVSNVKIFPLPKALRSRVTLYWVNVLRWCAKMKIIGSIMSKWDFVESYPIETMEITKTTGWASRFWIIEGFFQHEHYATPSPELKKTMVDSAEKILQSIPHKKRVAVHLRFGDYEEWTIYGKRGVCLPSAYYQKAMTQIEQTIKNPTFVIFSDDRQRAEKTIGDKRKTIYFDGGSPGIDLAGLSLCSHAIISASTFSWWGAYLIKHPMRIIIAPKYWGGFKSCIWFPKDIRTQCFEYIDISDCGEQKK